MTLVQDVMTPNPRTASPETNVTELAGMMRANDTGFIPIVEDGQLKGVVTDRDIVIRAIADGRSPEECSAQDVCSTGIVTVSASESANTAARQMRDAHVRRVAVVDDDRFVGVVAIGDLAPVLDPDSALAEISSAPPSD